jgi:hypothetical protein
MATATLAERPFWLTTDCPDWCVKDHLPGDVDQERHHADHGATVHLTLHDGWGTLREPQPVHVGLFQGPRETEAYVELFWPPRDAVVRFTLSEATDLATYICAAVAAARTTLTAKEHAA